MADLAESKGSFSDKRVKEHLEDLPIIHSDNLIPSMKRTNTNLELTVRNWKKKSLNCSQEALEEVKDNLKIALCNILY